MDQAFRVVAIISAFNEGDIIAAVIRHLVDNGLDVYLIDNHSTDDTVEQARQWLGRGLLEIEMFPRDLPPGSELTGSFDWTGILHRKEQLAGELSADWFIHHDADEIRESPWPGVTLKEAIRWVDALGYNCIDFRVFNFPPVDDGFRQGTDPREYFSFCEDPPEFDTLQLKCWKAVKPPVSLVPWGGHEARFSGRRVFPIQFMLRHYPIRSQEHGVRKVFAERKARFLRSELSQGWHIQYNRIADQTHSFIRDRAGLRRFDLDHARLELMLPEKILRRLADRVLRLDEELEGCRSDKWGLENQLAASNGDRDGLMQKVAGLQDELVRLKCHTAGVEAERDSFKEKLAQGAEEQDRLNQQAAGLRNALELSRSRVTELEGKCDELTVLAARLEGLRKDLESRGSSLEQEVRGLRNSKSWRWTAPLRRVYDIFVKPS
jgi:glycosyltransferase involved in cell wall biosynthesis